MKVVKNKVVSIAYQVRTEDGVLADEASVEAPLEYIHGQGLLISGLENALEGKSVGESFDIAISPAEGYGDYSDELVQRVNKSVFEGADELEVGMRFLADTDQGPIPVEITGIEGDEVIVDGNHILAGQNLKFSVEIVALRDATEEELSHGHLHSEHHHHEHGDCCHHDAAEADCCHNHAEHDAAEHECRSGKGHCGCH